VKKEKRRKATTMADSLEDDKLQYIKKDYLRPVSRPWFGAPALDDKSTGEDSIDLFMSEPSTSEADSSEQHMRLLSPLGSLSGDSDDPDCLPPPRPPPASLLNAPAPHSPGNTSLSSWESPHFDGRQVQIHFTPDRTKKGGKTSPSKFDVATRPIASAGVSQNSNMVFSASEDEGTEGIDASANDDSHETLDWEQQNTADDEKTPASKEVKAERQRRIRNGYRRQRNGDAAAATLSTGRKEWKGMEQDNIPMPPKPGDHDDEEDEVQDKRRDKGRGATTSDNDPSPDKGLSANVAARNSSEDDTQFSSFALGVSGEEPISRRQSRRQRRDSRARTRYGNPDSEESSIASTSPRGMSGDHPFLRESKGTKDGSSFSGWSDKIKERKSLDNPRIASNFAVYNPGSERNYKRSSYAHAGEFYNQGFHFGGAESPTHQSPSMRRQTWNQSPRRDGRNPFQHSQEYSPRYSQEYSPRSDSNMPLFRRSVTEEDTPLVQKERKRDEPHDDTPYASNSTASEKFRGVRFENLLQPTLKTRLSPFANIGRKTSVKADRRSFLPQISATGDEKAFPTYVCPVCKTRQREFFTVTSAPRQFESPSGYIAVYFGIYVIGALYIFGLQEGWGKLDCFYFAGK
jgi:hypothetical protein